MLRLYDEDQRDSNVFAAQDKAKQNTENMRGFNLAAIKLTTVQMTELPL
jgi:hypothetical protein